MSTTNNVETATFEATFRLEGNVFDLDTADPMAAAKAAWQVIRDWVLTGYDPVIEVQFGDNEQVVTVDLEAREIR